MLLINWTAATALQMFLLSLFKPLLETVPGMRPNDATHDNLLRLISAALAVIAVVLLAAGAHTLTAANAFDLVVQALYQFAGAEALYRTATRSGGSVNSAPTAVTMLQPVRLATTALAPLEPLSFHLPTTIMEAGASDVVTPAGDPPAPAPILAPEPSPVTH